MTLENLGFDFDLEFAFDFAPQILCLLRSSVLKVLLLGFS